MKTKSTRFNRILLGSALMLATGGMSQAEPSPELMNSISRMRLEAQKRDRAAVATFNPVSPFRTHWNWSDTRNITAGQSSVAVPRWQHTDVKPVSK